MSTLAKAFDEICAESLSGTEAPSAKEKDALLSVFMAGAMYGCTLPKLEVLKEVREHLQAKKDKPKQCSPDCESWHGYGFDCDCGANS